MFTGIIEEVGEIVSVRRGSKSEQLTIRGPIVTEGSKVGDSICVNGVCLTATTIKKDEFTADVMAETMRRTNLGELRPGSRVNLERAMPANGRFGGHIVSGHIDTTGTITTLTPEDNATLVTITIPPHYTRYIIEKGSITIDGISLTVTSVTPTTFTVSLIPHTSTATTLLTKPLNSTVNLETDIISKYLEKLLQGPTQGSLNSESTRSSIDMTFLSKHGYI